MGRLRQPTALRLAINNPANAKSIPDQTVVPKTLPPEEAPPAFLSTAAKKEWKHALPLLQNYDLITDCDRMVLAAYCQAYADYVEHSRKLKREKHVTEEKIIGRMGNDSGFTRRVVNPRIKLQRDAYSDMMSAAKQLGLTPVARAALIGLERSKKSHDKSGGTDPLGIL